MNGIGDMMQPAPQGIGAPRDPQEHAKRKAGWKVALQRLQNDPEALMTLFAVGQALQAPMMPGETSMGHFTNAAAQGLRYQSQLAATKQKLQEKLAQQRMAQEKMRNERMRTQAEVAKVPSTVELQKAQAEKARADAKAIRSGKGKGAKPGAQQQFVEYLAQTAVRGGEFEDIDKARLYFARKLAMDAKTESRESLWNKVMAEMIPYADQDMIRQAKDLFDQSYAEAEQKRKATVAGASTDVDWGNLKPGMIVGGYEFLGGDATKRENWKKVN